MGKRKHLRAISRARDRSRKLRKNRTLELEDGVFRPFWDEYPDVGREETRTVTLLEDHETVPFGVYTFIETFCSGPSCDCRRVMFQVHRGPLQTQVGKERAHQHILTIGYGWEPLSFYQDWMHELDLGQTLKGPSIELNSPPCDYGEELMAIFSSACLSSPEYVDRVRGHYILFKEKLAKRIQ